MSLRLSSRPAALVGLVAVALVLPLALRLAGPRGPAASLATDTGEARPGASPAEDAVSADADPLIADPGPDDPAGTDPACAAAAPEPERADFEERAVVLVNEERRAAGLPPLKRVEPLALSSRFFARLMAAEDYFAEDHDTYRRRRGRLVHVCDWTARIAAFYAGWNAIGENIASGYESPEEVVEAWMDSPVHRARVLGRNHWETGAGYSSGGSERHYWVQDFGRRGGVFPVIVEGEAPSTRSRRVRVFVYGSWRQMRVRNDDGAFSPWRTFESEFEWTLAAADGVRTVTVEMRGDRRRGATASDSIRLLPQPM
jgi:uncharacterized protein YkwD